MYIGVSSAWLTSAIRDIIIIALLERKIKQYNLAFFKLQNTNMFNKHICGKFIEYNKQLLVKLPYYGGKKNV